MGKTQKVPKEEKRETLVNLRSQSMCVSYFFHATRPAIKGQNPLDTFGEFSKIPCGTVGEEQKNKKVYKWKIEAAKKVSGYTSCL